MGCLTLTTFLLLASALPLAARVRGTSESSPDTVPGSCFLQSLAAKQRPPPQEDPDPEQALLASPAAPAAAAPRTLLWNGSALAALRKQTVGGKPPAWAVTPLAELRARADDRLALNESLRHGVPAGPWSPVDNTSIQSPDGDQRSFAANRVYAWPCNFTCKMALKANPNINTSCSKWTPSREPCDHKLGLPYVIHDGFPNLDAGLDSESLIVMAHTLELLTLAWWFTDEAKYSSVAMKVFETWFINNATRMNPHMEYGELMPGRQGGVPPLRPASFHFKARLNDCVAILETQGAKAWTPAIDAAWKKWSGDWFAWWSTSGTGTANSQERGDQGTYYHVHELAMAYSLNEADACVDLVAKLQEDLPCSLNAQIAADGELPEESGRVAGVSDSLRNLEGLISLAIMAQRVCTAYRCSGGDIAFDRETEALEGDAAWSETVGVYTKCGTSLGQAEHSTLEECKRECLGPKRPNCNTFLSRRKRGWYTCVFKDCRGEAGTAVPDEDWTLHGYTGAWEPGRGSIQKAFEYMEQFAQSVDSRREWLRSHPKTDTLEVEHDRFSRLGKLARMISSSLLGNASTFEAKVGMYDDQFSTSWESLAFPPPELNATGS